MLAPAAAGADSHPEPRAAAPHHKGGGRSTRRNRRMMTGAQYRVSLDDGRATFFEGERVKDLPGHPILGPAVDVVARCYDRFHSASPGAESPLMSVARSAADLKARLPLLHEADHIQAGGGLYAQRIVTRKHYDLDGAKRKALRAAGLPDGGAH